MKLLGIILLFSLIISGCNEPPKTSSSSDEKKPAQQAQAPTQSSAIKIAYFTSDG